MKDKKIVETLINENIGGEVKEITVEKNEKKPFKQRLKEWWFLHKPSKRHLIQVYAALLYNANIKGYITGKIFTGNSKVLCVPGLNCYSCPGAVGACPLGALQNALSASNKRAPYYMLGIILLYGLILGRLICGFLCPVGLAQDLLYKIKTPKVEKGRVTRVLSYLKYVILAVLVIGIPIIYAIDQTAVPGFCKYICPAGTFGGAMLLLIHPDNASMFSMLGALFTWKTAVLFAVIALCIFIYRAFCRFLCPLGAIYGLFNRFSLLGIKVNDDKCTNCGKCVQKCKMDVKKVGDHECINCGECMGVCPTKAIEWKGGKLFVNNIDRSVVTEKQTISAEETSASTKVCATTDTDLQCKPLTATSVKTKKFDKRFWLKVVGIVLMVALFVGVFTYANFFAEGAENTEATYLFTVSSRDGKAGLMHFKIGDKEELVIPSSGEGTKENPYILSDIEGVYAVALNTVGETQYYKYTLSASREYKVTAVNCADNLSLRAFYILAGKEYAGYDYENDGDKLILSVDKPSGMGNEIGFVCYDFTLKKIGEDTDITLSDYRGKIVIVNFWGTWCGPCVQELPDFEKVRASHENLEVIAVHSVLDKDGASQFLIDKQWDKWGVNFVIDTGTPDYSDIYYLLGGRNGAYPRTLILDGEGVIRYVFEGAVNEETLDNAVNALEK